MKPLVLFLLTCWWVMAILVVRGCPAPDLEAADLKASTIAESSNLLVMERGAEALRVSGLAEIVLGKPTPYAATSYARPKSADDVRVILTTEDGRRWRARWEEVATP